MIRHLVSVIIPCFNHGKFLGECIKSVLAQKYQNFEIIIINDGSTDNTSDVISKWKKIDKRIRSINNKDTKGPAISRNKAIRQSRGKYILPLDADDKIDARFISKCYPFITPMGRHDIVYTDVQFFGAFNEIKIMGKYNYKNYAAKNQFVNTALYHKKDFREVKGYNTTLEGYEDWEFGIKLGEAGHYGIRVPGPLFYYRRTRGSRNDQAHKKEFEIWNKISELHPQFQRFDKNKKRIDKYIKENDRRK